MAHPRALETTPATLRKPTAGSCSEVRAGSASPPQGRFINQRGVGGSDETYC